MSIEKMSNENIEKCKSIIIYLLRDAIDTIIDRIDWYGGSTALYETEGEMRKEMLQGFDDIDIDIVDVIHKIRGIEDE